MAPVRTVIDSTGKSTPAGGEIMQRTYGEAGTDSPVVDRVLHPLRNRDRPDVATLSPQVSDDPMALAKLEIL